MSIKLDDIMKVIIFFETMHCLTELNKENINIKDEIVKMRECATCEKCIKRVSTMKDGINDFYLGYILLKNQSEFYYKYPQKHLYIQEIILEKQENSLVYKLNLPGIGIIPDDKIIFTNNIDNYAPAPTVIDNLDYFSIYNRLFYGKRDDNSNLVKLTLYNYDDNLKCKYKFCMCKYSYTIILKEVATNNFCIKYIWNNKLG
jgi:hypothetical protein